MRVLALIAASLMLLGAPASADFYRGKTITFLVNYGAGGNVDTEARVFARHMPKHFPGKPNIIVQNLPGAGGLQAINMLGISPQADGLMVGFFTMNGVAPLTDDPALRVQFHDFAMIGGLEGTTVTLGRRDMVEGGMKKPADIAKAKMVYGGGYSKGSTHDIRMELALDLMGLKHKLVTGFPSVGAIGKALEQKEINFTSSSLPGYRTQLVPNLVEKGIVMPLWHYPTIAADGSYVGDAALQAEGIPVFTDVFKEAFGRAPEGPKFEALVLVSDISTTLQRGVVVPKGTPAEAVTELRQAYEGLRNDQDFIKEYERITHEKPNLIDAASAESVLERIRDVRPEIKALLKEVAGTGG